MLYGKYLPEGYRFGYIHHRDSDGFTSIQIIEEP